MNEQEKFLDNLSDDQGDVMDVLEQPLVDNPNENEDKPKEEGEDGVKPRNRRERRLKDKLDEERASSIFLAGKLEALSEASKSITEEKDYLKAIDQIFGTETPEAQMATGLLKKAIIGSRDEAKLLAIEEMKAERQREKEELAQAERELDSMIEDVEDTYDVTLTDAQQKGFFSLLQKMSPKDKEGNVIEYADPHAVWEIFQEKLQKRGTDTRAKDLSSRSMVQSGASKDSTLVDDSHARFLRENNII